MLQKIYRGHIKKNIEENWRRQKNIRVLTSIGVYFPALFLHGFFNSVSAIPKSYDKNDTTKLIDQRVLHELLMYYQFEIFFLPSRIFFSENTVNSVSFLLLLEILEASDPAAKNIINKCNSICNIFWYPIFCNIDQSQLENRIVGKNKRYPTFNIYLGWWIPPTWREGHLSSKSSKLLCLQIHYKRRILGIAFNFVYQNEDYICLFLNFNSLL